MKKLNVVRKNNCIINTGDNTTLLERRKRVANNQKIYGLSPELINNITLPKFSSELSKNCTDIDMLEQLSAKKTTLEMLDQLYTLRSLIYKKM